MPISFELETLKAQAVVSRTNVLYSMQAAPKSRHPNAHVCNDFACCTAYYTDERLRERWGVEYIDNIKKVITAVTVTDEIHITYEGAPILASFHSSSARRTESSENVWQSALPYLLSVESPETVEHVPSYTTTMTVSSTMFSEVLTVLLSIP